MDGVGLCLKSKKSETNGGWAGVLYWRIRICFAATVLHGLTVHVTTKNANILWVNPRTYTLVLPSVSISGLCRGLHSRQTTSNVPVSYYGVRAPIKVHICALFWLCHAMKGLAHIAKIINYEIKYKIQHKCWLEVTEICLDRSIPARMSRLQYR